MAKVADGATTRKERMIEMLAYIYGFAQDGASLSQVQLHMSVAHGLTFKTCARYIEELVMGKILFYDGARIRLNMTNYLRLLDLLEPDVNPSLLLRSKPKDFPDTHTHSVPRTPDQVMDDIHSLKKTRKKQKKREKEEEKKHEAEV